jgi:hypothetical protein
MSQPYKCIETALNKRFNLYLNSHNDIYQSKTNGLEWSNLCIVTQEFDELNEFIYMNEVSMDDDKRPEYFEPQSKWAFILLFKIKLRWETKVKQIKLGQQYYHVLLGSWQDQAFLPNIEDKDVILKIYPFFKIQTEQVPTVVLVPFKDYKVTKLKTETPELVIANESLKCVYSASHYNVSFNRQGLYINRKFREIKDEITLDSVPQDYLIIEPSVIEFTRNNQSLLKIKLNN